MAYLDVIFPAVVERGGGAINGCKVWLVAGIDRGHVDKMIVAVDTSVGPQIVLDLNTVLVGEGTGRLYDLVDDKDNIITVRPGGGCGCGSKLRSFQYEVGAEALGT